MSWRDREIDPMEMLHRASTEETVPDQTRARVWSAVTVALKASGAVAATASVRRAMPSDAKHAASAADAGASALPSGGSALRPWMTTFLHWSAPALVIGAAAGVTAGRALLRAESPAIRANIAVPAPKPLPSSPVAEPPVETPPVTAATTATARVASPAVESSAAKPVSAAKELARERALLDQARAQIAAGEPARALDYVERHERRHLQGALAEEREALAINALVSIGRYREAVQRGEAFRNRYPDSLLMPSVEAALAAIPQQ